jgi:methylase of polypeptide subunit release factors
LFIGTDINFEACKATQLTAAKNGIALESVCTSYVEGLDHRCSGYHPVQKKQTISHFSIL